MYSKEESEAMKVEGSGGLDLKKSMMPHPQEPTRLPSCHPNHEDVIRLQFNLPGTALTDRYLPCFLGRQRILKQSDLPFSTRRVDWICPEVAVCH